MSDRLTIESDIFNDARQQFNEALKAALVIMTSKGLTDAQVGMNVKIHLDKVEEPDEDGVICIRQRPDLECKISIKMSQSAKYPAIIRSNGYLERDALDGTFKVVDQYHQVELAELQNRDYEEQPK